MNSPRSLPEISPATTPVGWIGTGVMGLPMCEHLMNAGYEVHVHSRTRAKSQPLLQKGARWKESPMEVALGVRVLFTMLGFPGDVRQVYWGEKGVLAGLKPGMVLVDMTTTEPKLAQDMERAAKALNCHALDAPVSGGDVGAKEATLSIMVGGDVLTVETLTPLLQKMGRNIAHLGPAGRGQHAKMCNQILIAGTMIGMCESLMYGYRAGLDLQKMIEAIRGGAAGCWSLEKLAPRILRGDWSPGFCVDHFIKDMGIALREAEAMSLPLPGLALVHQLYLAVKASGHGRSGTQALMHALENLCGQRQPVSSLPSSP